MKLTKEQVFDFAILALRWYLAYFMVEYGISKLIDNQYAARNSKFFDTPLRDIDTFSLAWYLFFGTSKFFPISGGVLQLVGAALLVYNRTTIIGAFFILPILVQIFIIDVSYTTQAFGPALPLRLAAMIFSDFLILYYYKERVLQAWNNLTAGTTTKFRYKWWVFIFLPVLGIIIDLTYSTLLWPFGRALVWVWKHL